MGCFSSLMPHHTPNKPEIDRSGSPSVHACTSESVRDQTREKPLQGTDAIFPSPPSASTLPEKPVIATERGRHEQRHWR